MWYNIYMKKFFSFLFSLILVGALLYSGFRVEQIFNGYRIEKDKKVEVSKEVRQGRKVDFDKLLEKNKDVKGWIYIKDTNVDYPIVQGEDNDYYLHRGLDGYYIYDGCLFIDADVDNPFDDFNTVIYGHHMLSGAMFADLKKYADKEFFDEHKVIVLETPEASYDLHIVAFCKQPSYSEFYTTYFSSIIDEYDVQESKWFGKQDFVDLIKEKAINMTDEEFTVDDRYVTMSTCVDAEGEMRYQVIGIIKDAELKDKQTIVESDKPFINKWLVLQIAVGILMALSLLLLLPKRKKKDN